MGKRGLLLWVVLLVWSVAVSACGGPSSSPDRLQIDPPSATIDFGAEAVLHAQAFAGTEAQDAGPTVTWVSRDPARVQVTRNADGSATVKGLAAGGTTVVEAHLDALTATASITVGAAPIASIGLTPPNPSLALGTMQPLTATAMYADATTGDVTDSATWTSMNLGWH